VRAERRNCGQAWPLGSDKTPVRLAGLYALERLAHGNPPQRQGIVNVICAYLRMPYTPPAASPPDTDTDEAQAALRAEHREPTREREVRLAAQRILAGHLRPHRVEAFWANIDLDLTNARLIDFDLRDGRAAPAEPVTSAAMSRSDRGIAGAVPGLNQLVDASRVPRAHPFAFAEFRSAGTASRRLPRGEPDASTASTRWPAHQAPVDGPSSSR
jgi:hypothetical protein